VASVTKEPDTTGIDSLPIDVETISDTVDDILDMELSTSTRAAIDSRSARVVGHLNLLLAEDMGADADDEVLTLYRRSYALLELSNRPTRQTQTYAAFQFMHDAASLTRALVSVYASRNGINVQ
jgi:hypothetical protein